MSAVAVLGGGKIGEALLGGLVAAGRDPGALLVVEKDEARRDELVARLGIGWTEIGTVGREADVLVVAVKPPDVAGLLAALDDASGRLRLVISLAAGIPTSALEAALPRAPRSSGSCPTPRCSSAARCACSPGTHAGADEMAVAEEMLSAVGHTVRVPEHQQDLATALSGSGPAYVFLVAEAMIEAGSPWASRAPRPPSS